jgi:glycosyltransferase involved in cell wall biosynthesis
MKNIMKHVVPLLLLLGTLSSCEESQIVKDAKKFADKILFLKNNPDEYSKISEYCVNFAKDYDIEIYCKKLVDIYQNAINKKLGIN